MCQYLLGVDQVEGTLAENDLGILIDSELIMKQ